MADQPHERGRVIYTDGYNRISQEEFFNLQDRICAGDPVTWGRVVLNQRRAQLEREADADD